MARKTKRKTSAGKKPPAKPKGRRGKRGTHGSVLDAPPPPAPPTHDGSPNNTPSAPSAELVAIADKLAKSTDPLEGNALAHTALLATMRDVLADVNLSPAARRKELRTIAAAAKDLLPDARRYEAEQIILQDRRELEQKARARRGAKLEAAPPALVLVPPATDFGGEPLPELDKAAKLEAEVIELDVVAEVIGGE